MRRVRRELGELEIIIGDDEGDGVFMCKNTASITLRYD